MNLEMAIEIINNWEGRLNQIILDDNGYQNFPLGKNEAEAILFLLKSGKGVRAIEKGFEILSKQINEIRKEELEK